MKKERLTRNIRGGFLHLMLILLCALLILPIMWILATSLRLPNESFKMPPSFFPTDFYYQNYVEAFTKFPFGKFLFNSLFVAFFSIILQVIVSTMSGYAFARIPYKGRDIVFLICLAGTMIPSQATMIPTYIIMSKLKLVGSVWSLILPSIISPMGIFLVRQYMLTIPASYEEAAYIDGASRWQIYIRIMVPMSKSVIAMTAINAFLASWNEFMKPLLYLSDWDQMTLPIGLRMLQGYMGSGSVGVILAGVMISIAIPTVIYLFGSKYMVEGMTLSGLKA